MSKLNRLEDIKTLRDVQRWRGGEGAYTMSWALHCIDVLFAAVNAAQPIDASKGGLWSRSYKVEP